jgi:hypothetical protein
MPIHLTKEQQQALDSADSETPEIVDPRTNSAYVLVPAAEYQAVREVVEDDRRERAIRAQGLRNAAGRIHDSP